LYPFTTVAPPALASIRELASACPATQAAIAKKITVPRWKSVNWSRTFCGSENQITVDTARSRPPKR